MVENRLARLEVLAVGIADQIGHLRASSARGIGRDHAGPRKLAGLRTDIRERGKRVDVLEGRVGKVEHRQALHTGAAAVIASIVGIAAGWLHSQGRLAAFAPRVSRP